MEIFERMGTWIEGFVDTVYKWNKWEEDRKIGRSADWNRTRRRRRDKWEEDRKIGRSKDWNRTWRRRREKKRRRRENRRRRGNESKNCHARLSYPALPPRQALEPSIPKENNMKDIISQREHLLTIRMTWDRDWRRTFFTSNLFEKLLLEQVGVLK